MVEVPSGVGLVEGCEACSLWCGEIGGVLDLLEGKPKAGARRDEVAAIEFQSRRKVLVYMGHEVAKPRGGETDMAQQSGEGLGFGD